MKIFTNFSILLVVAIICACSKPTKSVQQKVSPFPVKYENELFSINVPKGWEIDDEGWKGLDSVQNEVELYNPNNEVVWFHCVKVFLPIQWKNIEEATELAKTSKALSGQNASLIDEIDSVEVGGYPAHILYFANYENQDTIIQKQFVTYCKDSHIVIYFNENFFPQNWDAAQELGDEIMRTVKIKHVKNPLDDKKKMEEAVSTLEGIVKEERKVGN